MVFLRSELTRPGEKNRKIVVGSRWWRGILGEPNRIYELDSAVVPKGLFGRGAQITREILKELRKDPHLDQGRGSGNLRLEEKIIAASAKK